MNLADICRSITKRGANQSGDDEKLGLRLMHPEYSIDNQEVKYFPNAEECGVFILFWRIEEKGRLYASIKPFAPAFSYSYEFENGDRTQLHTHDYIELAYVAEGELRQRILGRDVTFCSGDVCLIDKNCMHQDYLFRQDTSIIFIGLANDIFDEAMVGKIGDEKILYFLRTALMKQKNVQQYLHFKPENQARPKMEACITELIGELELEAAGFPYICKGLLIRILNYLSTEYDFQLSKEQKKRMGSLVLEEMKTYIGKHFADVTIKELADRFHFNEDYFNRILKENTGRTYSEYVRGIRLAEAEKLLRSEELTVEEIANRVGYHNKGYFYKIFVERYGMTPAALRKKKDYLPPI